MMNYGFETFRLNLMAGSHKNFFVQVTQRFGILSAPGLNDIASVMAASTPTFYNSPLDQICREAESMAVDLIINFDQVNLKKPTNKYCSTLWCSVKKLSDRHDLVFKGMVNRLKPDETNAFPTFVIVADEIFNDGQVNWGRIVAVYAFAARLAKYYIDNNKNDLSANINESYSSRSIAYQKKFGLFVGKFVAKKLGKWIFDNGGWSRRASFAETVVSGESPIREKYHSEALPTSPLISCREKSGRKGFFSRPLMRLSGYRTKLDSSPKKELPFTNLMKKPSSPVKAQLSQGTQKPTQESQLDSTGPIFPDLIGCCKPLDDILPQLTSSLGYRGLCQLMKGRNLNTIGDLSSLTEVQINQLPIRNPKVQPVKTTLTSYMGKHGLLKVPICEETKEALTSQPTIEDGPENVKPDEINQDQRSGTVSQDLPGENDIEQISVQEKADSQAPNVNSLVLSTLSNLKGTDLKKYQHIPAL